MISILSSGIERYYRTATASIEQYEVYELNTGSECLWLWVIRAKRALLGAASLLYPSNYTPKHCIGGKREWDTNTANNLSSSSTCVQIEQTPVRRE